ncbi:probable glucuronosyltransferase Os03g0107900 [Selaginella moellendorffii]|uniref:probable glucuronosyltransferase Os03g0107900 n=1 Tax=Selaginella moellendorffii TaxID=88036 RepID=UPI000D1CF640|nr:probable glucuronosyltransferase Os03g0107900 [Selaginella moellendorffii]|eukprot:XP_024537025.1 probable glucuronosyltransferase Os03g0107900 [Selaginella moellendorffii]
MGSSSRGACSSSSAVRYLGVVVASVLCTRLFLFEARDRCGTSSDVRRKNVGEFEWPELGYGSHLALRIYVYQESEVPGLKELLSGRDNKISPEDCLKGQYGTQVKIHKLLLESRYRTLDKDDADFFFVPTYVKCVRMKGGLSDKEIDSKFIQIVTQMPYFRRSGGRDHVFVFPSGIGAHIFKHWPVYLNRSIFLTPEGDRTDKRETSAFNTWKDVIIPGNIDNDILLQGSAIQQFIKPLPLAKRNYLANYFGRAQNKTGRLKLLKLAKLYPDELEAPDLTFSASSKLERKEYFRHLRNAKFCLSPRGESSWTLRFFESFFVECVPVILSDRIELPFQNVLDYRKFSIKWPSSRTDEQLLDYLRSIPDYEIEAMISRGRSVRCLWLYVGESHACSAMTGILWELQRKSRRFHQSQDTFWLHNQTLVDEDLNAIK